jgi:hypothetical protein
MKTYGAVEVQLHCSDTDFGSLKKIHDTGATDLNVSGVDFGYVMYLLSSALLQK